MAAASFRSSCVVILMLSAEPGTTATAMAQCLDKLAVVGRRSLIRDRWAYARQSRLRSNACGVWAR